MKLLSILLLGLLSCQSLSCEEFDDLELDPNGYILYCPCMGRFGNQADHFLGALAFAHGFNRTLVLPPWVEYRPGSARSVQIPFDTYFQVEPLREYQRVMTMERFMEHLAPQIWPAGERTSYCYSARRGASTEDTCNAKEGNPFGPFWDTFEIDFDQSVFYGPLHYDTHSEKNIQNWKKKYPTSDNYVMAFTGAPGAFPVTEQNTRLQKYLRWSDKINEKVDDFFSEHQLERPLLSLHFRHGTDWERACEHIGGDGKRHMFASAQCLGFRFEHGQLTTDLCLPPRDRVLKQIKKTVKKIKPKSIFIATDAGDLMGEIRKIAGKKVNVVKYSPSNPHVDLAIMGRADFHIGNCVSTFSAFVIRERRSNNKPVSFWAFDDGYKHEEL